MVYCQLTLRPALFLRSSLARLVDQEIIELFPLDRCDEPTGSSAATCPSLARWTTIFECDFSPSHRAYTCPTQAIPLRISFQDSHEWSRFGTPRTVHRR